MPEGLLIIVFDEEVAPPGLATALEVIAPMSPSGFLTEAGRGYDGRRHRHQIRCFPGLEARPRARLSCQFRQLVDAPVESSSIPEPAGVTAHDLLQRGDH
jgi:hypothetical protein